MLLVNIIPAPKPKKAVWYDPNKDELVIQVADVIGLMEIVNPDNMEESTTAAMYLTPDTLGVYFPPQFDVNFIEFIELNDSLDLSKYADNIEAIKALYKEIKEKSPEIIEVEQRGNVSTIKNFIRRKKEVDTDDN